MDASQRAFFWPKIAITGKANIYRVPVATRSTLVLTVTWSHFARPRRAHSSMVRQARFIRGIAQPEIGARLSASKKRRQQFSPKDL
jgi:hypothetical protein